jgi:hypothetical protein
MQKEKFKKSGRNLKIRPRFKKINENKKTKVKKSPNKIGRSNMELKKKIQNVTAIE